jgi:hypothetical protein
MGGCSKMPRYKALCSGVSLKINEIGILGYGELEDELTVIILHTSPSTTMLSESQI